MVGLQADLHERTELPELYRSHIFPPRCPSVFLVADDTTYLIARVLTWHTDQLTLNKYPKTADYQNTYIKESSDPKLEVTSFTDKYMVPDFNNLIDSLKMRSKHQELFSSRSFLFSAVPNYLKVMHTHKPQTLFVYLNLEN